MPKLWEKTGDAKNTSDLVEVDTSNLVVSKPTVVYFPGQLTSDDNTALISRDLHDVKAIFHDLPEPPQVYLWSHPEDTKTTRVLAPLFRAAVYNLSLHKISIPTTSKDLTSLFRAVAFKLSRRRSSTPVANDLAKSLIMPLVTNAKSKPLPFKEAQKNLRNLTFLGYSYGGFSAQDVYNASLKMMLKSGYNRHESRRLLQEIVLVTIGSVLDPRKEKNRYTTISLFHNDDGILSGKNRMMYPLRRIFFHFSCRLKIKLQSDTSILVSATVMGKKRDRHKETQKEVIEGVRLPPWRKKAFNHFFTDYINTDDKKSQVSRIVPYALTNAVNRKGTIKPVNLLAPPATQAITPEITRYIDKIGAGLYRGMKGSRRVP